MQSYESTFVWDYIYNVNALQRKLIFLKIITIILLLILFI